LELKKKEAAKKALLAQKAKAASEKAKAAKARADKLAKEKKAKDKAIALKKKDELQKKNQAAKIKQQAEKSALAAKLRLAKIKAREDAAKKKIADKQRIVEARNQARAAKALMLVELKEKKLQAKRDAQLLKQEAAAKLAEEKAIAAAERQKRREEVAQEKYASRRNPNSAAIWASFAPPPRPRPAQTTLVVEVETVVTPIKKQEKLSKKRPYPEFSAKQTKQLEKAFVDVRAKFVERLEQNTKEREALTEELSDPNVRKDKMNDGYPVDEEISRLTAIEIEIPVKLMWLDEAELKFKKKKFGRCDFCYEDIIFDRLLLYPELPACIKCSRKI